MRPNLKRVLMKGALQGINWDCNDPTLDPGGIWNDVQLLASRDLYVEDLKVTPFIDLEGSSARVLCRVTLCNTTPGIKKVSVTGTLSPHNFAGEPHAASTPVVLPPGVSQTDLWLDLDEPRLWWPWDMGAQNLYDAAVSVADEAGELDRVGDRIGLRHLRKEQASGWEIYLNGKRIFCRGPNYVSEQLQSAMTRARYEFDVQLMKDANMNMVRSYCVVEREEFYDVCDEKGVMVYQDFPTTGRMSNRGDFVRRAVQQGRRMVNQLYHHPSIVLWSWGSQPAIKNFEKLCLALATACAEEDPHRFIQQGASVWQWRTAKEKFDWPIDFHLLAGWFHPDDRFGPFLMMERDECNSGYSVEELNIKRKELLEFVSEYGPPEALPELASLEQIIPEADRWPVNWDTYARHCLHGDILRRWIGEPDQPGAAHRRQPGAPGVPPQVPHRVLPPPQVPPLQRRPVLPVQGLLARRHRRSGRLLRASEACLLHAPAGVQPDPRADGLAAARRRGTGHSVPQGPVCGQRLPPPLPRPADHVADLGRFRLHAPRARGLLQRRGQLAHQGRPRSPGPSRRHRTPATASPSS